MQGTLAVGHGGSAAWPAACLAGELGCVSWGLWTPAALCWIAARSLLSLCPRLSCGCPGQGGRQVSVLCLLYSFLGRICNAVGALLASQLGIQMLTGAYMAVADIIRFLLTLFPPCLPESQKPGGLPRRRRRRRRLRDGLLILTLPLSVGAGWSLLAPGPRPPQEQLKGAQRRLLGAVFEDNTEALGFVLGLLSTLLALMARMPRLSSALWATLCSAAAGILRAAAIVTHDQQPGHILRALPWLLVALGSAALDMAILFITFVAKNQMDKQLAANWAPLTMFSKPRSGHRMVATSHCLDLMIRLVQQADHGVVRLPEDAQMGAAGPAPPQPSACPLLPGLRPGLSSSSNSNAASNNSELEWDLEDVTVQWSQPSPAAQPCSMLCPGTFRQHAAPPRHPERLSPQLSKQ
ncbi:transmembrane protein 44 [Tyto alba]|uniref:transmembrane protein 44 n=1 Tax=Tyto alba TaxID=56313 RepID=UPI001C67783D|nr:transmembrane protein 44 [Tyto alba]